MKKIISVLAIFCFLFFIVKAKSIIVKQAGKQNKIDTLFMDAILVKKQFTNKGGKEIKDVFDLYLVNENIETFVKISESNFSTKELNKLIGKEKMYAVEFKAGNWDAKNDDHDTQSRYGKYCVLLKVIEN